MKSLILLLNQMEVSEFYHVIDRMDLPKVNAYGLTPKTQEDGSEKLYVFKNLYDAKMYSRNKLGGIILKFNYKFYVNRDLDSGFSYIETTIPVNKLSVYTPKDGEDTFTDFNKYYQKAEEGDDNEKVASKLFKIAAKITICSNNGRGK